MQKDHIWQSTLLTHALAHSSSDSTTPLASSTGARKSVLFSRSTLAHIGLAGCTQLHKEEGRLRSEGWQALAWGFVGR